MNQLNKEVRNEDLFYCYSKKLSMYIYTKSGITPLTVAKNLSSDSIFSLFSKSDKLQKVLDEYARENNREKSGCV